MTSSEKRPWLRSRPATPEEIKSLPFPPGVKRPFVLLNQDGSVTDIGEFRFMPYVEQPPGNMPIAMPSGQ